jgi:hypothetical protein
MNRREGLTTTRLPADFTRTDGGSRVLPMNCPLCDCSDWESAEKNKDGVNLRVRCRNCGNVYPIRFRAEKVVYRMADTLSHGYYMQEVKIPNDTGVFRVWVSIDKVA